MFGPSLQSRVAPSATPLRDPQGDSGSGQDRRWQPERLALGNLSIRRDWGWAPDYVEAMWKMLQCEQPDDFVVASGVTHSLEEFVAMAFAEVGLNWRDHVDYDSSLARPSDIMCSLGDPSKAAQILDWRSTVKLPEIVARMVRAEREGAASV